MRKSINVETVFGTLTKEVLAKGWKTRVDNYLEWLQVSIDREQQVRSTIGLRDEIEFAKANIELLSEKDYNWLLEQEKSPTIEPKKSKRSLSIDSPEFKKALAEAPFVCKTHCDSEELPIVKKPADSTVKKVRKPKVKEEWVLYDVTTGKNLYYRGDSILSSWYLTDKLEEAKKFPTYSSAVKVNYKLVNLGYANFSLSESKDFE